MLPRGQILYVGPGLRGGIEIWMTDSTRLDPDKIMIIIIIPTIIMKIKKKNKIKKMVSDHNKQPFLCHL